MASSVLSLFVVVVLGVVGGVARAEVPLNTTVGMFGPLSAYQPFDNWLYPPNTTVPLCISLGNASLAFNFGFQLTYGISTASDPKTYIRMGSTTIPQYTHLYNFTGNLLSNKFWWNTSVSGLQEGSYLLTTSASYFACSADSADLRTDIYWTDPFQVGQGGTIPANSTGNTAFGNNSLITKGMYDCTALRYAKSKVSAGLIGTYGAGILFTGIVMMIVRGKDPVS